MTAPRPDHEQQQVGQVDAAAIASLASQRLESHPHFHHHCQTIHIEWIDNHLVLSGRLPSFHLKQLAQEAPSGMDVLIDNQIDVVCCDGLSSSRESQRPT